MNNKESPDICNSNSSLKRFQLENDAHLKQYIVWENRANICWLDASMALIAHNNVMKRNCTQTSSCIGKIISAYNEATRLLNTSNQKVNEKKFLARQNLNSARESTLRYLQPILKYEPGNPESSFVCLYNLINEDREMKKLFTVTWMTVRECTDCGYCHKKLKPTVITTLPKVDSFNPEKPHTIYNCDCNRSVQKTKLEYVNLPPCLIFHFESGAGKEKPALSFTIQKREYHLTGIMTLEKIQDIRINVSHFITWIRDPFSDKWLDCNDLNPDIITFSPNFPDINLQDVYIYVYESFDNFDKITATKIENTKSSDENIPCIDLSEESDTEKSNSQNNVVFESNKNAEKIKTSGSILKSVEDINTSLIDEGKDKSLERVSLSHNKCDLAKNTSQSLVTASVIRNPRNQEVPVKNISEPINTNKEKVTHESLDTDNNDVALNEILNTNVSSPKSNDSKHNDKLYEFDGKSEHFLSDAITDSSGTSYVKVSVRRKKIPHDLLNEKNNAKNPKSNERCVKAPSSSKSMKRRIETRGQMNEDCDYLTSDSPAKKKQVKTVSKATKDNVIKERKNYYSKARTEALEVELKNASKIKSKLNLESKQRKQEVGNKVFSGQNCSQSGAATKDENSEGKILRDFEDVWSCHKNDCNCDTASLTETIDTAVDYTLAYLFKLSQECKKP